LRLKSPLSSILSPFVPHGERKGIDWGTDGFNRARVRVIDSFEKFFFVISVIFVVNHPAWISSLFPPEAFLWSPAFRHFVANFVTGTLSIFRRARSTLDRRLDRLDRHIATPDKVATKFEYGDLCWFKSFRAGALDKLLSPRETLTANGRKLGIITRPALEGIRNHLPGVR
jgi:hypothetical protein